MANIRTLKLNLLADTTDFAKGIKKASGQTESFSSSLKSNMKSLAKSAALAGVAVAGMAVAFGVDAVKAALEDEKSQTRLAKALKNTTKATKTQIASVEALISKMQFQYGVADDKLRPAFQRLVQGTQSITKSQGLLQTALDISAATGKDLETVSLALSKAYNGNIGVLKKMGLHISDNIVKAKDFNAAMKVVTQTVGGQAQVAADTFAGRMQILSVRFSEFKEGIGYKLIPPLTKLMDYIEGTVVPLLGQVGDGFSGKETSVSNKVKSLARGLGDPVANTPGYNLGKSLKEVADSLQLLFDALLKGGSTNIDGTKSNIQTLADAMVNLANGINSVAEAAKFLSKIQPKGPLWQKLLLMNPATFAGTLAARGLQNLNPFRALGGGVTGGKSYIVGEHGPELFTPMGGGTITPNSRLNSGGVTIVMNGIIDGESARRSIERLLQQSSIRTGAVNLVGSAL